MAPRFRDLERGWKTPVKLALLLWIWESVLIICTFLLFCLFRLFHKPLGSCENILNSNVTCSFQVPVLNTNKYCLESLSPFNFSVLNIMPRIGCSA